MFLTPIILTMKPLTVKTLSLLFLGYNKGITSVLKGGRSR
jgi:hypothetical protein